ncbi:lipopolysaccharide biosynthesis protein [Eubacterium xylanophilum]|uniref:lipopolysaccharide biosynthesis protein n=1 Tax=Eubacterium xylanophilum TaxID=39497 RepID=UPI0004B37E0E|nr:oligosaccharide flippase family protein [Eubacterium xylanophilum]
MIQKLISKYTNLSDGAKSGIVFTIATLFTKGLAIITVPIFTRIMSSDQIGVVNIYSSWFSMISVIATLSLTSGGYQLALKEFNNDKDGYESSVLSITTIMGIVIFGLFLLFPAFWSKLLGLPTSLCFLLCIGFLVSPAQDFWMSRQRFEYKYKLSGIISIITTILASIASVVVVVFMTQNGYENTATGRLWANYIFVYGTAFIFLIYIFAKGKKIFVWKYWKFSLSLSIPLMGHAIAITILDLSDRQMISKMVNNSAVGIYSTLYIVSSISLIVWNAINASFVPYLFKNIDDEDRHNDIRKISSLLLIIYCLISVVFTYLAPEIVRILATNEYFEAVYIMPPIAMGVSLTAVSNMYSNILVYYKKTKVIMISSIVAAISNLILNYVFIRAFGYQAAAYTTLVSYVILTLIEGAIATRIYKKLTKKKNMIYPNNIIFCICLVSFVVEMLALLSYKTIIIRYVVCASIIFVVYIIFRQFWGKLVNTKEDEF